MNGNRLGLERGGNIYKIYCGKYVGTFFDFFSAFFCYICYIVMCGCASSTAAQQWGLPNGLGAVILTAAVIATVILGFNGIVSALSKLGPIIIILILCMAAIAVMQGAPDYAAGISAIDSGLYDMEQVGGGNPYIAGASYGGFVILWFASFMAEIGSKRKLRDVIPGMLISAVCIFGAAALCCIALISHIALTWDADIPTLVLERF